MNHVYLEIGPKRVFACSIDWPGWCRIGKSEDQAIEALLSYESRYRLIAERAALPFDPGDPVITEHVKGDSTTDFGAPGAIPPSDFTPVAEPEATRAAALLTAAWAEFDAYAQVAPEELRKGPRGGGRDRTKMIGHVFEAERAYARKAGLKPKPIKTPADLTAMRTAITQTLGVPSDTPADHGWPARYTTRRIIWHVLDHLWEMQDRSI
ncbi:hypothetical protein Aph01nite_20960 [Acrocarpospora phusangensis]|uniref:DinB-like domain-containing protein n=1 Tax=Acrocarpospora phusangensis TaxID=1070424 RepID=A0A919Q7T5_9ACTN|nr:hypothetical protein [Acrocarpospora phusangensis]GIH23786.1 hypothetical protein Aph01nite_20960 [Acrocarpospora phusangensis]